VKKLAGLISLAEDCISVSVIFMFNMTPASFPIGRWHVYLQIRAESRSGSFCSVLAAN
jgi:hypothetical protein